MVIIEGAITLSRLRIFKQTPVVNMCGSFKHFSLKLQVIYSLSILEAEPQPVCHPFVRGFQFSVKVVTAPFSPKLQM